MNKLFQVSVIISLLSFNGRAQSLDLNNVSAIINTNGVLFLKPGQLTAGYEIPNGSGINAIFAASLWCGATDSSGMLHLAAMRFGQVGNDYFPGPYSATNDYTNSSYISAYGTSRWFVTKSDIQNHIANYTSGSYTMPTGIATWPGNGISGAGIAQNLAPFIDMNNNGLYEPMLGDYPDIRGDAAYYTIMNDSKNIHTESGGDKMGIEVHTMAFQFLTNDYLNNTTFLHYRVFNRGGISYQNFKLGMWWDPDLGNPIDDYVGCDTLNNLMYVYNGDNNDQNMGSALGYGVNPPAVGIRSLTKKMDYFSYFTNGSVFPYTDPFTAAQYFNFMSGMWANGSQMYQGGNGSLGSPGSTTQTAKFLFPGNPNNTSEWSEMSLDGMGSANPPGDRRGVMTLEEESLPAGGSICYDFAVLYAKEVGNNNLQNVNSLISIAATAKTDFDAMTMYNCNLYTADVDQLDPNQIGLYPNPSHGVFNLSFGETVNGTIQILDMAGRIVFDESVSNQTNYLVHLNEVNGVYLLKLTTEKGTIHKKINIQE